MTQLAKRAADDSGTLELGAFKLAKTGLVVKGKPSFEEWQNCGGVLQRIEGAVQFWIGDWLNWGEHAYGEKYAQAINQSQAKSWQVYAWVAGRITTTTRVAVLSWTHHREVARLDQPTQEKLLNEAVTHDWTVNQLKQAVRVHDHQQKIQTEQAKQIADGEYAVVCADPPWDYDNSGFDQAAAGQYPTLPTPAICELPDTDPTFPKIAADAVLFLWVTSPMLPDGLRVLDAWGFSYRASFVWLKNRAPGLGWWANTKHEIVLVGERGTLTELVLIGERGGYQPLTKPDSVIMAHVAQHSQKPDALYDAIEQMYPGARYVECFARAPRSGWDVWGNEV